MSSGLSSWLRSLPLRRRVAYLTTVAVALAVAASGAAAYVTIRVSLYRALDNDLTSTATSVAAVTEGVPPALDLPAVAALAYLGLVGSALAYVLWFRGLTRMDAGAVAVIGLVNPVVGTVLGVVLLAEPFGPAHLGALAVVLGSVIVSQAPVRRRMATALASRRAATRHTVDACPT